MLNTNDSLTLNVFIKPLLDPSTGVVLTEPIKYSVRGKKNGWFEFVTPRLTRPCYITLSFGIDSTLNLKQTGLDLMSMYLLEPGDNVLISVKKDSSYWRTVNTKRIKINDGTFSYIYKNGDYALTFSGKGAAKFKCRYTADRKASAIGNISAGVLDDNGNKLTDLYIERMEGLSIALLKSYRSVISPLAYQILYADFLGKYEGDWYRLFGAKWFDWHNGYGKEKSSLFFINAKKSFQDKLKKSQFSINLEARKISIWHTYRIIQQAVSLGRILNESASVHDKIVYEMLKVHPSNEVRDRLLTSYIIDWYIYLDKGEELLNDALANLSSEDYRELLYEFQDRQVKGKKAYNFSLIDTAGTQIRLNDFLGKVVLIDFWYTGCSNCIIYNEAVLREVEQLFTDNPHIKFVSINIDKDKARWITSIKSEQYTSPRTVNLNTNGVGAEHPVIKNYHVTGYPRPILIDSNGLIFSASANDLRNKEKLKNLIFQALKKNQ